jgi:hypothetical protein
VINALAAEAPRLVELGNLSGSDGGTGAVKRAARNFKTGAEHAGTSHSESSGVSVDPQGTVSWMTAPATVDAALREEQAPLRLPFGLQRMDVAAAGTAADGGALEQALDFGSC